jgi:hypothetical protein
MMEGFGAGFGSVLDAIRTYLTESTDPDPQH